MNANRRFRRIVLFTALAGHLAYAIAAEKPGLALIGVLAAALSAWLVRQSLAGTPRPIPRGLLNGLVIVAILHLIWQLLGRTQEPITSLTDFLAYVMLVKSLDRSRARDEAQFLGLSLFVVIGALLTGQSLAMGIALIAYTPLAITATVSLQLFAAIEHQHDLLKSVGLADQRAALDAQLERQQAPRATAFIAAACVVASMFAGVVAFVITPRSLAQQLGFAATPFLKAQSTDFSDSIKLGQAGNISQDNTPVLDVRPVTPQGSTANVVGPIYLRGAVLTNYNKETGQWSGATLNGVGIERQPGPNPEKSETRRLTTVENADDARSRTTYEIIQRGTKPNQDATLFAPLQPLEVSVDGPGKIVYRKSDALLRYTQGGGRLVYTVTSASDYRQRASDTKTESPAEQPEAVPAGERAPSVGTPGSDRPFYPVSPAIKRLADDLLRERTIAESPYESGPLEVRRAALAVSAHLASFTYSLDQIAPPEGRDPVEMFLFETRQGHCEYFASAMVTLLRAMGIPARIATGFVAAEYNNVSGYFTVRKSDAHAWVEVQMEPGRWDTFDPTPAGELQSTRRAAGGPIAWMKHLWDAIEFSWLDNVVAYDKGIKLDVIGFGGRNDPGAAAVRWQERMREVQNWVRQHLPQSVLTRSLIVGAVTFVVVMAVYGLIRTGNRFFAPVLAWLARVFPGRRADRGDTVLIPRDAAFYKEAIDVLSAAGSAKPAATPPLTFAQSLGEPVAGPFRAIAVLYYRSRFSGTALTEGEQESGRLSLAQLKAALSAVARPKT